MTLFITAAPNISSFIRLFEKIERDYPLETEIGLQNRLICLNHFLKHSKVLYERTSLAESFCLRMCIKTSYNYKMSRLSSYPNKKIAREFRKTSLKIIEKFDFY